MKIPLKFIEGRVLLNASIRIPHYRTGILPIQFVVDTGSHETFISEGDALRLGIPINSLKFKEYIRMGGSTFKLLEISNVNIYFRTDEDKIESIIMPSLSVAKTTKTDQENKLISQSSPSIIGTDFLIKNKFILYLNPINNDIYLQKMINS